MKFGSWPPPESAPLRIGTLRSGAVSSSWTWNLLSFVFMAASLSAPDLRGVSLAEKGLLATPYEEYGAAARRIGASRRAGFRRARSRRPRPPGSSPSRKAQSAIRSGWAIWLSTTERRRRGGVGWPLIVIVRRSPGSGCARSGAASGSGGVSTSCSAGREGGRVLAWRGRSKRFDLRASAGSISGSTRRTRGAPEPRPRTLGSLDLPLPLK